MASRLYRTTRSLYLHVEHGVQRLGLSTLGTPTVVALITLYVTGVLLLDARPTQTRVTRVLPARCHDALNRLLRTMPLSTRALMQRLIAFARQLDQAGYLCLDDVIVEKAYAKRLPWAGWTYSFAKRRKVYGVLWSCCGAAWMAPGASQSAFGSGVPSARARRSAIAPSWSWPPTW
jgi:hypothetical protein